MISDNFIEDFIQDSNETRSYLGRLIKSYRKQSSPTSAFSFSPQDKTTNSLISLYFIDLLGRERESVLSEPFDNEGKGNLSVTQQEIIYLQDLAHYIQGNKDLTDDLRESNLFKQFNVIKDVLSEEFNDDEIAEFQKWFANQEADFYRGGDKIVTKSGDIIHDTKTDSRRVVVDED